MAQLLDAMVIILPDATCCRLLNRIEVFGIGLCRLYNCSINKRMVEWGRVGETKNLRGENEKTVGSSTSTFHVRKDIDVKLGILIHVHYVHPVSTMNMQSE